jgi:N-acetylglucosamine malate deacetylase 2
LCPEVQVGREGGKEPVVAERDREPARTLPQWRAVLAVVAHPDDESFGMGAVLAAFSAAGSRTAVACLTHGEASTLHGVPGDLHRIRAAEFAAAAAELGVSTTILRHYADGKLATTCRTQLIGEVLDAIREVDPDGLLAFDPSGVTGHPDHAAATAAARDAAAIHGLPVLSWTLPAAVAQTLNTESGTAFAGHPPAQIDLVISVDRTRQRAAVAAHASQALPTSVLWRRLDLLGDREYLRYLHPASGIAPSPSC